MPINPPQSTARMYFEQIKNQDDAFSYLSEIPLKIDSEPFFEEEWIDFKGEPQNDKDAQKIWSKALSGFANSTDGLLIWGIDARKTPQRGIDAACGLRLISEPHAFVSKLRDWVRDATNPPVVGVEYEDYLDDSGKGFVVCLIPESNYKPHRAEYADKHYYFRAGDNFLIAAPSLLRTLFYPQTNPYLWLEINLKYQLKPSNLANEYRNNPYTEAFNKLITSTSSMSLDVFLHNTGTSSAKDIYAVLHKGFPLNYQRSVEWVVRENIQGIAFHASRSIHPGEITKMFSATFQQEFYNKSLPDSWEIKPHFEEIFFHFNIYADNLQKLEFAVGFIPENLDFESGSSIKKVLPKI